MFSHSQIDELLQDTTTLVEQIAQLDEATNRVQDISNRIAEVYLRLRPRHEELYRDLEQLGRLQEVLRNYVFIQSSLEDPPSPAASQSKDQPAASALQAHILKTLDSRPSP